MQSITSEVNNDPLSTVHNPCKSVKRGGRAQILCPDNSTYYSGSIKHLHRGRKVTMYYDDGEAKRLNMNEAS